MAGVLTLAIVIHLTNLAGVPDAVMRDAEQQVVAMFRDAGVHVGWNSDGCVRGGDAGAVRLTLLPFETGALQRDRRAILGAAMPSSDGIGTAWVFYNRVGREADRHGVAIAPVLASAIAHEIGHLLQRHRGHAERGLMRASWNHADYLRATNRRLRFSPADAAQFESSVTSR
jgi:hypothetical protein